MLSKLSSYVCVYADVRNLNDVTGPYTGDWQKSLSGGGGNPLTGTCKTTTWEGGHRMVGVMRWLNHIQNPGRKTTAMVSTTIF